MPARSVSDVADGNAHVGENVAHQAVRTAVELRGGNHLSPAFNAASSAEEIAAMPEEVTTAASAPSSAAIFRSQRECGIAVTRVDVRFIFPLGPQLHFSWTKR